MRIPDDIHRHQRLLGILQDTLHRAFGGLLHSLVDLFPGHRLLDLSHEINHGAVPGGNTDGHAVKLALEFGKNYGGGHGGPGGGGDHGHGRGSGTAQVFVRQIQDSLVVGIGVHGGHQSLGDAEGIVEHLGHRSETIGGT